jgi:hypothetical protein
MLEVFIDDFISLIVPSSQSQLDHVATATIMGIHYVLPPDDIDANDPISKKKLKKGDKAWAATTEFLGLMFDGEHKTEWLASNMAPLVPAFHLMHSSSHFPNFSTHSLKYHQERDCSIKFLASPRVCLHS